MTSPQPSHTERRGGPWFALAVGAAAVAGAFSLVVLGALAWVYVRDTRDDPNSSPRRAALKTHLTTRPSNAALAREFRQLDAELRARYFARRQLADVGVWLLLGGGVLTLAAAAAAVAIRRRPPHPGRPGHDPDVALGPPAQARWAVTLLGCALAGGAFAAALVSASALTPDALAREVLAETGAAAPAPPPTDEEIAAQWPRFRGPGGAGVSAHTNVPETFDLATGRNVLWKSERIPLPGKNSPVVWGDRVFVTGATEDRQAVFCYNADSGELVWTGDVPGPPPPEFDDQGTGYAASTVVTDGRCVAAIFANGSVAGFDMAGRRLWLRNLGAPTNMYGYATSLVMYKNLVIVQFDQGGEDFDPYDPTTHRGRLIGIDWASGQTVWEEDREVPESWATPLILDKPAPMLVTCANPLVIAYDPSDGSEIWRAEVLDGDVASSPIPTPHGVIALAPMYAMFCIRPGGHGDVTDTHVVWQGDVGVPEYTSPVSDGERLFTLGEGGMLSCLDPDDGELLWEADLRAQFQASPTWVGDRLYLLSGKGAMFVLHPGPFDFSAGTTEMPELTDKKRQVIVTQPGSERKIVVTLERSELGEKAYASPAFLDGRIYLRGDERLYCIGTK